MPLIKKEPLNDAAQDKYDLYKSQERLRALLNKKHELINELVKIGNAYTVQKLFEEWDIAIEKEAKVLLMFAQFIERQNDINVEIKKETGTKQISLDIEKITEIIKQGVKAGSIQYE
ncbi:hypothetical protein [Veillonella seminalis]|uniref:Uncharacterized protein n=1 Tax=Veillonella seminalis ACS-216-V-Col6b TaxID=883156 RepID=K9D1Z3_9FIRM|nr:hypothetical protein [Veillonella seminalis]EKU78308.1 hypothetical protein HMPREF9282_01214 [Veillonella seminalis ACS-216-V-Col6b]